MADGIWGRRTNSAAVRFAKISKLPTSTEELISEQFFDALAAAKKGTCPKPKAVGIRYFSQNYSVSCSGTIPGMTAYGAAISNLRYNRSNGTGKFNLKWEKRSLGEMEFEKKSPKVLWLNFSDGGLSARTVLNSNGKVIRFVWQSKSEYCTEYTAEAR